MHSKYVARNHAIHAVITMVAHWNLECPFTELRAIGARPLGQSAAMFEGPLS